MQIHGERAQVLVTVKATPQPSAKYGETVCVAGLRLDTPRPEWIRLYPVAFRWLDGVQQFKKYNVIEVEVRRVTKDSRPESYAPTHDEALTVVDHFKPWKRRIEVISQVEPTTTCELSSAAKLHHAAPSLGLVYPRDVDRIEFEPHPPWTPAELKKMQDRIDAESGALLPTSGGVPTILRAPRFKALYRYRCDDARCNGHQGRILDWELSSLESRYYSEHELKRAVTDKFLSEMCDASRKTGFFMGNFEAAIKRDKFSVLGVYWPPRVEAQSPAASLF